MIKKFTYMEPADNCGVWWVSVFHLYYGSHRKTASVGDFVKVSVKSTKPLNWIQRKSKMRGIIIRVKKEYAKYDGSWIKLNNNNLIFIRKGLKPYGALFSGPLTYTIKRRKLRRSFPGII